MTDSFRLLVIGAANVSRSAMAERMLREVVDRRWNWSTGGKWIIESAGTRAAPDNAMHPLARRALGERFGVDEDFRSRPVTADLLRAADLVLTCTREQRAQVAGRFPWTVRRTFALLQFARLAAHATAVTGDDPVELGHLLVQEVQFARSDVPPARGSGDDIADTTGRSFAVVRRRAGDIERAVDALVSPLVVTSRSGKWAEQTAITRRAAQADGAALPVTGLPISGLAVSGPRGAVHRAGEVAGPGGATRDQSSPGEPRAVS